MHWYDHNQNFWKTKQWGGAWAFQFSLKVLTVQSLHSKCMHFSQLCIWCIFVWATEGSIRHTNGLISWLQKQLFQMSREKGRMAVATKAPWIEWVSSWSLIWEKRSRLPLLRQVPVDNIDNSLWFNCVKACDSSALSEQSQALLICAEASQQESINSQQNPEECQLCVNVYKCALQTVKSE